MEDRKETLSDSEYQNLIENIEIKRILLNRMDFKIMPEIKFPDHYKLSLGRSDSKIEKGDDQFSVVFGFEFAGEHEDTQVFIGHIHFQVIYMKKTDANVYALLEDERIKETFMGRQQDLLVWSYLRRIIQQLVSDAGLPPVTLPLNKSQLPI